MMGSDLEVSHLVGQLEALRRENSRMRRLGWLLALGVLSVLLLGQAGFGDRSLEGRQLVLRDEDGVVRSVLATLEDGATVLSFYDVGGRPRAVLGVSADGAPFLQMTDRSESLRVSLQTDAGGAPALRLSDGEGRPRTAVGLDDSGNPELALLDRDGRPRAKLGLDDDGAASLRLRDRSGMPAASLLERPDGTPALVFRDPDGRTRTTLDLIDDGSPRLRLLDPAGQVQAVLDARSEGATGLYLGARDGRPGLGISQTATRTGLFLLDGRRTIRADLSIDPAGVPTLELADIAGHARAVLGRVELVGKRGDVITESALTFLDPNGKVIWQAPKRR